MCVCGGGGGGGGGGLPSRPKHHKYFHTFLKGFAEQNAVTL